MTKCQKTLRWGLGLVRRRWQLNETAARASIIHWPGLILSLLNLEVSFTAERSRSASFVEEEIGVRVL
jgi:hypothetical protein